MSASNRIKELVYSGMVLDEHGMWITLGENLRKEKKFIKHLEQGEILHNGKWVILSDILQQNKVPDSNPSSQTSSSADTIDDETTIASLPVITPDETVSFSRETLRDFSTEHTISDFESETSLFRLDKEPHQHSPKDNRKLSDSLVSGETRLDIPFVSREQLLKAAQKEVSKETEFEETVLYNINILKASPAGTQKKPSDKPPRPQKKVRQVPQSNASDDWELTRPKPLFFVYLFILIVVIVIVLFVIKSIM